jgi:hypothetical protein
MTADTWDKLVDATAEPATEAGFGGKFSRTIGRIREFSARVMENPR